MDDAMEDGMEGTMDAMDGEGMDGEMGDGMDEMEDKKPVEEIFDITKCPSKSLQHNNLISV